MNVLVDTPIWSLLLRRRPEVLSPREAVARHELAELIREGRVVLIGPIRQEILSGISDNRQFGRLRERLRAFEDAQLQVEDYEEAARCSNACRSAGVAGGAVDFLICAAALRRNLAIFTTDHDFQLYAKTLQIAFHPPRT
ncbi:MAG: PIN domain-containing protein [Chloroflexi bacterium]|nr:PIN domain-containing protein [Chloroflexota bacterium]